MAIEDRESHLANANRALRVLSAGNRTLLGGHDEQALLRLELLHVVLVIGIKFVEKLAKGGDAKDLLWTGLASAAVMAVLIAWNNLKSKD